ncbi:Uncharacterised protein [Vibrio cholerae]|uniref:Uncharacterized protein n=1 Tax=Vibrio cholerae TaxID=666 RepID=A0A655TG91_VIBCL|nr:Uncharacterised protein [Vibrio cholerae]CSB35229.1 Uncharacterised protein [Vibrio cholerae]CSC56712.1 Uncharacterised protein [Vibrio cholerae]
MLGLFPDNPPVCRVSQQDPARLYGESFPGLYAPLHAHAPHQ